MEQHNDQSGSTWPLPKFEFRVNLGNIELNFQEVSGLINESNVIEYRSGNSPVFSTVKMPGIQKFSNVTLKKGIFVGDHTQLLQLISPTIKRSQVQISLLDENKHAVMTWKLTNAFITKMSQTDLKADGNEIAIESIELAHEGLTLG